MLAWLRRNFIAGFFVTIPLVVSVVAVIWVFRFADGLTAGLAERLFGRAVPGLGLVATAAIILVMGALTANMFGRRLLDRSEQLLLHLPVFRTIYAPVKQLLSAFSPENEVGFKRMVLIEDPAKGVQLGFLTKEFTVDRGRGAETFLSVYVPTNHLYLGDIVICPVTRASFPAMTVEEGVRVFLTGGTALPEHMRVERADNVD
jgi:uncharacterized membrane protein